MGKSMLIKVGWKKDFVEKSTPVLPISGWMGDNLLKKSDNMGWWKGADVDVGKETIHVDTLYDCLDKMCRVPERPMSAPMRMPISGIYKIKDGQRDWWKENGRSSCFEVQRDGRSIFPTSATTC